MSKPPHDAFLVDLQLLELSSSALKKTVESGRDVQSQAVSTRFADLWLLGGASILLWAVMAVGSRFRESAESIDLHFFQMAAFFSLMSIFCNHPHFMISYRFGYGRGVKFVGQHWFKLLVLPLGLIALYAVAYAKFNAQISDLPLVVFANHIFEKTGWAFRLGKLDNLGIETLSLSVLLMNLTVGWHYSKQVFGCIMVYSRYDRYPLTPLKRNLLKANLFGIAFLNFFYLTLHRPDYNADPLAKSYFFNIPMIDLGLPSLLLPLSAAFVGLSTAAVLFFIFYANFKKHRVWPSANLIVPWIAFHIWWIPILKLPEYYFLAIPFFHSLQYLPFAYRLESPKIRAWKYKDFDFCLRLALLLFVGFCAFELVPSLLDRFFETTWYLKTWFFMIAFAVFINIHHFFIDSVVWKFDQADVRENLLR
jgi:hypothetical protein